MKGVLRVWAYSRHGRIREAHITNCFINKAKEFRLYLEASGGPLEGLRWERGFGRSLRERTVWAMSWTGQEIRRLLQRSRHDKDLI